MEKETHPVNNSHEHTTELVEVDTERTTPAEQILAPLDLSDYSQFLYDTNFGGVSGITYPKSTEEIPNGC